MAAAVEVVLAAIYAPTRVPATVLLIDANAEDEQRFREELDPARLESRA